MSKDGGYDFGYRNCDCFWGEEPGRLVVMLGEALGDFADLEVLDAGCGEGKNAVYIASLGGTVKAVDISAAALHNGKGRWGSTRGIDWIVGDIRDGATPTGPYDVVVAYGLLHCLPTPGDVADVIGWLQRATRPGGYNVLCTFNDRGHDLRGHPQGFRPTLLPHAWYVDRYRGWEMIAASDEDLSEQHPPLGIPHVHSMTRILARRDTS